MKILKLFPLLALFLVASCSSVHVMTDYDTQTNFSNYKTFAFYKKGIDKVKISDLDKRRILKAVESELLAKGLTKSEKPDILVNIFTKSKQQVEVRDNRYFSIGWYPWYYGPNFGMTISKYTQGTLFVDLIDTKRKELVWQGIGRGALSSNVSPYKKEARIKEFVVEIMAKYPPKQNEK